MDLRIAGGRDCGFAEVEEGHTRVVLCLVEWSCPMSEVAEMAQGKDANFGKIIGRLRVSLHTTQHISERPAPQESGAIHELHAPHH